MTTAPTCIIAYASEDDRYDSVVHAAMETARQAEARLILYNIDAAPGGLGEFTNPLEGVPRPTFWSGDIDPALEPGKLDPQELEYAGRQAIARDVARAREQGIDAFGWLPRSRDVDDLIHYAEKQGADLIMLPETLDDPSFIQRLRGQTAEKAIDESPIPIALVDESGRVQYPAEQNEPQHQHEARSLRDSAADQGRLPREGDGHTIRRSS